jgi:hypothetical protein
MRIIIVNKSKTLNEILKAYYKWFFYKKTNLEIKRLSICKKCPNRTGFICSLCGCVIYAKARSKYDCPAGKWHNL